LVFDLQNIRLITVIIRWNSHEF